MYTIKTGKHAGKTIAELAQENPGLVRKMAKWDMEVGEAAREFLAAQKEQKAKRYAERYAGRTFIDAPASGPYPTALGEGDDLARASVLAEDGLEEGSDLDEQFWNRDA